MPTIETDLGKILERIEGKIDGVAKDVADIKIDLATTKAELKGEINTVRSEINTLRVELKGEIKALGEKTDGLSKRVDSVDFINRGVFVALIIAILGGFAKIFGFIGNP